MTLLYRAIWCDELPDVVAATSREFAAWVAEPKKYGSLVTAADIPTNDKLTLTDTRDDGSIQIDISTTYGEPDQQAGIGRSYRADLIETHDDPDMRWHTTVRAWQELPDSDSLPKSWLWVDTEVVGDIQPGKIANAAPRIVRTLIGAGSHPHVGPIDLFTTPTPLSSTDDAETLAEDICDPDRALPIIAINASERSQQVALRNQITVDDIAVSLAQATAGIASVYLLSDETAHALTEALGHDYGLWGGVMRIFLPEVDPADDRDSSRHRYFFPDRYCVSRAITRRSVVNRVAPLSALRRPPASYAAVKRVLDAVTSRSDAALLALADADLRAADDEILTLRKRLQDQDQAVEELAIDLAIALEQRAVLAKTNDEHQRHISSLQAQLAEPDEFYAGGSRDDSRPATCTTPSEAAQLTQQYLADYVVLPDTALIDLDELDATVASMAWGQTSWEAFQALHAYASDRAGGWDGGGFWEWCKTSGNLHAWRASTKKLSMRESDSVRTRDKYRRAREFPVPKEFSKTGVIYMEAHMKIAEGGGDLAPRIYFSPELIKDKVVVGFFGPHRYVPNTKS